MNYFKRISVGLIIAIICIFSFSSAYAVSSPDESVLTAADENLEPLYTIPVDSNSNDISSAEKTSKDYALFYTQTTFLALLAGYLILFKVKGIDHSQKMHRRNLNDN